MNETYVVIGGAGFIGSHLVDSLIADGGRVVVIDDLSTGRLVNLEAAQEALWEQGRLGSDLRIVEGDASQVPTWGRARELLCGVDVAGVFHLAAVASIVRAEADPAASERASKGVAMRVIPETSIVGARIVFASSIAVYGEPSDDGGLDNATSVPASAPTIYGRHKRDAEIVYRQYAEPPHSRVSVVRLCNVYGPRAQDGVIANFCRSARVGQALTIVGDGEATRDFVYVDDVVRMLRRRIMAPVSTSIVFGTGTPTSVRAVAESVRDAVNCYPLGAADVPPPIERRAGDPGVRAAWSRAKLYDGVPLQVGLRRTLAWWLGSPRSRA